ncbi:MAG: carbohydrate ABC transporter substrate-binding protein [Acholeplasmatales bacterium]|nr:carbohydrate ABC transporter substrate-binding protein [Acholeplasmatales bacterium]
MKKIINLIFCLSIIFILSSCGKKEEVFTPVLDTTTDCKISIVGSYDNFEALELEFDRFNDYYPNVKLQYTKLDDYNNILSTALEGNDKPNIFFSYTWIIGNEKYDSVVSHMEDLSNKDLNININCLREALVNHDVDGEVLMVPVFSRTYGMLVNNDLFKKEKQKVPTTWDKLIGVGDALIKKGYKSPMMGYSKDSSNCFMNTIAYPIFLATLSKNSEALSLANNLDPQAGPYMREALESVKYLVDSKIVDLDECDKINNNYNDVIMRFFEGDVPMMICNADTASGTKKREKKSEAFTNNPFKYSFAPIPMTDGGYFIDSPSVEFSVNKNCDNLDMTNEFMRFLISNKELNMISSTKGLVTPTKKISFDSLYVPFSKIPAKRIISPEVLGIKDPLAGQIKNASFRVGRAELTIEEAIAKYGSIA